MVIQMVMGKRALAVIWLLIHQCFGSSLVVNLTPDTTLSGLVEQGVDVRYRTPQGRRVSFYADSITFRFQDGFQVDLGQGECIIRLLPNQKIWNLDYYEREFSELSDQNARLIRFYETVKGEDKKTVRIKNGRSLLVSDDEIVERLLILRKQSGGDQGWFHFSFYPRKLPDHLFFEYIQNEKKIGSPQRFPDHDMTPIGNFPGSKSTKDQPVSDGWRSPAQPGTRKRVRDDLDQDVAEVAEKNPIWWAILAVVAMGVVWLVLKGFFQGSEKGGR